METQNRGTAERHNLPQALLLVFFPVVLLFWRLFLGSFLAEGFNCVTHARLLAFKHLVFNLRVILLSQLLSPFSTILFAIAMNYSRRNAEPNSLLI